MKKLKTTLMVAIMIFSFAPSSSNAQEIAYDNAPNSSSTFIEVDDIMAYRNRWRFKEIFPEDAAYIFHMNRTKQEFERTIGIADTLEMDPHRITVVFYDTVMWNAETQTIENMEQLQLPVGSKFEICQDITEMNPEIKDLKPRPSHGTYKGSAFTVLLPGHVFSWDYTQGKFGHFTTYGYCHIDPIARLLSSAPPGVNDPGFNGSQAHLNGNVANVSFGNFNMGTYIWAFVPRSYSLMGHFDSGVDTMNLDMKGARISYSKSYNVPLGNLDIKDSNGHGTRTASIMSAVPNNSLGLAGYNYQDSLAVYKVWAGGSMSGPMSYVTSATNYAHTQGVKNKNYSLGGTTYDPTFAAAIASGYSTYNSWTYSAAGNTGSFSNSIYPACLPKGHSTVGTTISGGAWSSSTTSDSAFMGASATNMYSAIFGTTNSFSGAGVNGTSFAAPLTTALFSRVRNYFPSYTVDQVDSVVKRMLNGGGTRTASKGWGIVTDSLQLKELQSHILVKDTLYLAYCSGKYKIGGLDTAYKWVDSGWVGTNALLATMTQHDTINTNLVAPGMYLCKRRVGSIPDLPNYTTQWNDSSRVQVIFITGTFTGTVASTSTTSSASSNNVCVGTTLTITKAGNTANAKRKWYKNGVFVDTTASIQYTVSGTINDTIMLVVDLSTTGTCWNKAYDTSIRIITKVPNVTPSVSISANPGNAICAGTSVTFTAVPTNGGSTPSYQWKIGSTNVGTNSSTFASSTLNHNEVVTCVMTSNATCASPGTVTSNSITMTVTTPVTPSVSISANPSGAICAGTSVTFTATPTHGGSSPSYQWKVNGSNVGTNSSTFTSSTLNNGDAVTCVLTSSNTCVTSTTATSSAINMSVTTPVTPSVSIVTSASGSICPGTSVTFTATPTNGGSSPSYQWKKNGGNVGTNSASYMDATLANGDNVTCVMTSNLTCVTAATATSNGIVTTVNPTVVPTITVTTNPGTSICAGTSVTFTASTTNGGSTPSYQWKIDGSNVGTNSPTFITSSLANGQVVKCELTSNATCASPGTVSSTGVSMTVNAKVAAPALTVTHTQPVLNGQNKYQVLYSASLAATPTEPIDWYLNINGTPTLQATITTGKDWLHVPMTAAADTVFAVRHLDGCYLIDSAKSNTVRVSSPVSVAALADLPGLQLYPNPTTGRFAIKGLPDGCTISIHNIQGQLLELSRETTKSGVEMQFDLSSYAAGVYMIQIHLGQETKVYRMSKQ